MTHPHEVLTNSPAPSYDPANHVYVQPGGDPEGSGVGEDAGFPTNMKFETRLEAKARERREEVARIEAELTAADARGELWTVQAAMWPGKAFVLVYHGNRQDMEPLESQHGTAYGFLGPVRVMGDQKSAMRQAFDMLKVDEITIRVIR